MKTKFIAGIALLAAVIWSCDKVDNFLPNVDILTVTGSNSGFSNIQLGENVIVTYKVSDDELGRIEFEMKKGFYKEDSVLTTPNDFRITNVANISGKSQSGSFQYPTDVSMTTGPYHLSFAVYDANENKGKVTNVNFVLAPDPNTLDIVLTGLDSLTDPKDGDVFVANRAKEILPVGQIVSANNIKQIKLDFVNEGRGFQVATEFYAPDTLFKTFDLSDFGTLSVRTNAAGKKQDERYLFPPYATTEEYIMMMSVTDVVGNTDVSFIKVRLK